MTMPEQVSVTHEDERAAHAFLDLTYGGLGSLALAFARHRQAAIQKARADALEEAAKVAESEGGDEIPLPGSERQMHGTYAQGAFAATQAIATAIRQLQELGRHV